MCFTLLLAFIFYLLVYIQFGETALIKTCRQDDNITLACNYIPKDSPKGLVKFHLAIKPPQRFVLNSTTFNGENWQNLKYLIFAEDGHSEIVHSEIVFNEFCFQRLEALEELHIHVWHPTVFHNSFSGLDRVKTLDFSGCGDFYIEGFILAINGSGILPGLKKIVLSNWNLYEGSYAFDDNLVETLLPRNITDIDISNSQVSTVNLTAIFKKLQKLQVMNASYAVIDNTHDKGLTPEDTRHIDILDISHALLPKKAIPLLPGKLVLYNMTTNISDIPDGFEALFAIKTVNVSGILSHLSSVWLYNITVLIDESPWSTKTIRLQQNNLKRLDIQLFCEIFYFHSIQALDFSDNGMEFLHPSLLSCCRNLNHLDLSKNQLSNMAEENSALFQNLFLGLKYLTFIGLSANGLRKIPSKLFQNLLFIEDIDLSFNRLEQVTFTLDDLENLKVLNLRGNYIHILNSLSVHYLNSIPQTNNASNSNAAVLLESNPISCSVCEAKPFLQWLISTNLINKDSQRLNCFNVNDNQININKNTVEIVQKICEWKKIKIFASISAAVTLLIFIFCIIIIYRRCKRKQKIKNRINCINNLRNGKGHFQFAVFLSYSYKDEDFVTEHISDQLDENLQLMTGIDRTLVCTGDQNFRPGFNIHDETFRLLDSASVLIVVVSNHFLTSDYCNSEVYKAYDAQMPIVLMLIEQVDLNLMNRTMKELYQKNTRILWTVENGENKLKTPWENVCQSVLDLIQCGK